MNPKSDFFRHSDAVQPANAVSLFLSHAYFFVLVDLYIVLLATD